MQEETEIMEHTEMMEHHGQWMPKTAVLRMEGTIHKERKVDEDIAHKIGTRQWRESCFQRKWLLKVYQIKEKIV